MEHHIYLTFLTAFNAKFPYDEDRLRNTLVSITIKKSYNEIIQTSESVLKTVLHDKRDQFTLEKLFFFFNEGTFNKNRACRQSESTYYNKADL